MSNSAASAKFIFRLSGFRFVFHEIQKPLDRPVVAGVQGTVEAGPLEGHFSARPHYKCSLPQCCRIPILLGYQIVPLAVLFYLKEEISTVAAVDFRVHRR